MLAQTSLKRLCARPAACLLLDTRRRLLLHGVKFGLAPAPETRRDLLSSERLRNDTIRHEIYLCALYSDPLWPPYGIRGLSQPIGYSEDTYWKYTNPAGQGTFSILLTYMTRPIHPTPRRPRRGGSGFRVGASPRPPTDPSMWPGPASQPCLVVSSWRARRGRRRGFRPCAPDAYHLAARWVCGVAKACWRGEAHSTDQHGCSERTWVVSCFGVTVVKLLPV